MVVRPFERETDVSNHLCEPWFGEQTTMIHSKVSCFWQKQPDLLAWLRNECLKN
jgi:hypothetical protein